MTGIIFPADERKFLANISEDDKTELVEKYFGVDLYDSANDPLTLLYTFLWRKILLDIELGENTRERAYLREFMSERSEDDE